MNSKFHGLQWALVVLPYNACVIVIRDEPLQLILTLCNSHAIFEYSADRHTCALQLAVSDEGPNRLQVLPPCLGAGLVQDL